MQVLFHCTSQFHWYTFSILEWQHTILFDIHTLVLQNKWRLQTFTHYVTHLVPDSKNSGWASIDSKTLTLDRCLINVHLGYLVLSVLSDIWLSWYAFHWHFSCVSLFRQRTICLLFSVDWSLGSSIDPGNGQVAHPDYGLGPCLWRETATGDYCSITFTNPNYWSGAQNLNYYFHIFSWKVLVH